MLVLAGVLWVAALVAFVWGFLPPFNSDRAWAALILGYLLTVAGFISYFTYELTT